MPEEISHGKPPQKLQPPVLSHGQVPRIALRDLLCDYASAKLLVLCAPAGFGKTSTMSQAFAHLTAAGIDTAWLSLDRQDNDPVRLLGGVASATAHLRQELTDLSPMQTVEFLSSHAAPFVLFLDEFELIQEPDTLNLLREIIEHLPRHSRIVLGSRTLPELGLGRLRARGQLAEINSEQLRFTLDESSQFMHLRQIDNLPAEDLVRLHTKTEGWVTALWLASVTLAQLDSQHDFIERFSGTDRALADYLAEDVLNRQSPEIRQFLLRTSILRQLTPSICSALVSQHNGRELLDRIADMHLFVTPIPGESDTYRYHSLFADYLRSQLAREQPEEPSRLHLIAAGWYESHGQSVPAIDHAIEGGDHPYAIELLDAHILDFLKQGRMRLLSRWFAAIPESLLLDRPLLILAKAWATCFTSGPWDAHEILRRSNCFQSTDSMVVANVRALNVLLLLSTDRHDEAYEVGVTGLKQLPTPYPFADSILLNCMSHLASTLGKQAEAQELMSLARKLNPDSSFNRMYTDANEGVLDLQQGRLRQASARFQMAANSSPLQRNQSTRGNAWACVLLADSLYEVQEFAQCEQLLNIYLPLARDLGLPERMISCHLMLARIAFYNGDIDKAFEELLKLEYHGQSRQLPRLVATARLERSRLLLLQGNSLASQSELMRANDPTVWDWVSRHRQVVHDLDYFELARMRWEVAFGDAAAMIPRLREQVHKSIAEGLGRRALKLDILRAVALAKAGSMPAATRLMTVLLEMACQEGFVRLILDEGSTAVMLIHKVHAEVHAPDAARRSAIFLDYLQRIMQYAGPLELAEDLSDSKGLLEPLTPKEDRVLQLLAQGYSNSAMSEKLFVSDSTVRTHLRNINMKLNAGNRTQAVAIAKRLKLVR